MSKWILAGTACLMLVAAASAESLPWHQSLSLANGGYWPERVCLAVTNSSVESLAAEPFSVSLAALTGRRLEALRVCRADGVELLFDVRDAQGLSKRTGELKAEDSLIVPVECAGHAATNIFIYAGNSEAWPVLDFLSAKLAERARTAKEGGMISIGAVERLSLDRSPAVAPKAGRDWQNWAEVRVRNFSKQPATTALVRVNTRQALARLPSFSAQSTARVAAADGKELPAYALGSGGMLLFNAELPPTSERLFQLGFVRGPTNASSLQSYSQLLSSRANLVPNGNFEEGLEESKKWVRSPGNSGARVKAEVGTRARFGARALELTVADNSKGNWVGWSSAEIPVKPGAMYLLSGWLQASELKSWAAIHAHFHDAKGAVAKSGGMVSTQPTVSGNSDWVNSMGFFQAPPDAASIQIHLTMNTEGTLRHDGVVLCEVVDAELVRVHSPASQAGKGLRVWEVNPLVKVFPDTPPAAPAKAVSLELAGNEYQAFQLVLRGADAQTNQVTITVSDLKGPAGAALPAVKIERVGFVPIDYPSAYYTSELPEWCRKVPRGAAVTDGWAGWWPDPLAPGERIELVREQSQPVWFTVHAPVGATPGEYRAQITMSPTGEKKITIPLSVQVLPFELPKQGHLRAVFDFRFGPGGGFGSGADTKAERRKWLEFIAEHRLGIDSIQPPPQFTYKDGKVTMDAAEFDEAAHFCFDELGMNVAYTPQFFYMFGWAYPPKKLFGLEPLTPDWKSALQQAYRLFSEHLRAKGWHDKFVYYISDEPHFDKDFVVEQMKSLCSVLHEVDSQIPIYSSTWRHCAAWDEALDLWGVGQYGCFPVNEMERSQRAGKQMWFTCDGQMATDTPFLATERLLPYYCFRYDVRGFEFWGLAWWTYDPWKAGWHQFIRQSDEGKKYYWIRYPDGDGFLAYPGKPVGVDGPVSTIRLEQVRQGLQDYEALLMLKEAAAKAKERGRSIRAAEQALSMARELVSIPNAGGLRSTEILPDPDRIPAIRKAVNAALVELSRQK